jgi:hypothetical protein
MMKASMIVRTVAELKAFFFNTLIHWMAAHDCSSFHDFFALFFFLVRYLSCIFLVYFDAPFGFNEFRLFIIKKKKKEEKVDTA